MSLRDDASLILIPSAIKDGEVLVQKPLPNKFSDETGNYDGNDPQGSANLTFTRNSNATRVNADGLVEKVRTNSVLYSEQFDNAYWLKNRASISADTTDTLDPFGENNAEKITQLSGYTTAPNFNKPSVAGAGIYTASIFAKKGTFTFLGFSFDGVTYFDLDNGTIGTTASGHIPKIEDYGNGWYRCSVTKNLTGTTFYAIYPCSNDGNITTPDNEDYAYVFGAQLEQGLVATDYIETTTTAMSEFAGVTASSVADVPRLDYSGGSCPSLLLEPQRTNGLLHSEYFDSYSKGNILSITTNATTSPEGVVNASKLIPNTTNAEHIIYKSGMGGGATANTQSIYAKAGGYNFLIIRFDLPTSRAWFNLSNGTIATLSAGVTATIEDAGNGWYRCSATLTTSSYGNAVIGLSQTDGNHIFAGNGTDGIYIYGWQSEAGASYPTSLIPTYGTTVTRLADSCSKTGISSLIGQTEGTLFVEFISGADDATNHILSLSDGTTSNRVSLVKNTSDDLRAFVASGGASQASILWPNYAPNTNIKAAISYKANEIQFYANGESAGTDTSALVPASLTQVEFETSGSPFAYPIKQLIIFPTALSATDLANLTTL
jgi:hypothetical protein